MPAYINRVISTPLLLNRFTFHFTSLHVRFELHVVRFHLTIHRLLFTFFRLPLTFFRLLLTTNRLNNLHFGLHQLNFRNYNVHFRFHKFNVRLYLSYDHFLFLNNRLHILLIRNKLYKNGNFIWYTLRVNFLLNRAISLHLRFHLLNNRLLPRLAS